MTPLTDYDGRPFLARLYDLMVEVRGERFADSMAMHIAQGAIKTRALYDTLLEIRATEMPKRKAATHD